ncbi:dedicator of cytokinesis protein 9 isoform X2 [Condylostylus longicornis]|uniref:dedicator of cytokinesis protein 9 isoform X2 n=1 Tax=Condylostylus longicornis TaxID=2530218 RepID=UPI00244E3934|nr:dedicator of cytokinesis protein 9 isoform X2 [Condylostylus longicornis]
MTERKFTRGLIKPGMAAQLRETVSQVVRESAVLNKPLLVEPIDFESFVQKNKTLIQNDPQRELLLFPNDDVSEVVLPRKFRTVSSTIPQINLTITKTTVTHHQFSINSDKKSNGSPFSNGDSNIRQPSSPTNSQKSNDDSETTKSSKSTKSSSSNGSTCGKSAILNTSGTLLTRQSLFTYQTNNHLIHYKYKSYSGSVHDLPRLSPGEELKEQVYEIDVDQGQIDEEMTRSQADTITKQGYLLKGPETNSDRMFAHIGSKSFKRRYCYLRQEVDGTYILELHKDEKQGEAKATIVMDFCTEVVQNPKRGKFCFELRMTAGHKSFTLAAENEDDFKDWIGKLLSVLQQNKIQEEKRVATLERAPSPPPHPSPNNTMVFGTLKGLEQSMNPQLIKYGRETDISIAQARREHRRRLFANCQTHTKATISDHIDQYREQFGQRILIKCKSLKFRLQNPIYEDDEEIFTQVEPYITSLALYDVKAGKKLTENFYFDLNNNEVLDMLPQRTMSNGHRKSEINGSINEENHLDNSPSNDLKKLPNDWLSFPKNAILSVTLPHPDIFLVVKIEKILQGGINQTTEPYIKAGKDPKLGAKLNRIVRNYSQKIGNYRMPFAWAARPLFRLYSSDLDMTEEFPAIYRQEGNKLKDEELLKLLSEYRKPDKFSKLTVIPGCLKISIEILNELPNNCLTSTLAPLKPFPLPPQRDPTIEISEFLGTYERDIHPFTTFVNHLYVYPISLLFDSQKLFSRARNITVVIELRDSDDENSVPLKCIYGRPGQNLFVDKISCPVIHHNANPTWYEEIKMRLPLHITPQHHILFSFLHVSCNLSKKRDAYAAFETPIGYSWLPLLNKGKINLEEQIIPVAASLPVGYLAIQPLGLGKGNCGPEIQWIDNQRQLFTVAFRLDSTVLTSDQHLHNLFAHVERLMEQSKMHAIPAISETCKILKAAHAIQISSLIAFLPTILNQLFTLLVNTTNEEIGLNIIRLLINIIHMIIEEAGRKELLFSYVKYVFYTPNFYIKRDNSRPITVHEELCRHLPDILHPNNTDFLIVNKFMKYSNIFFDIIIKSMAQHLLDSGRIRMLRNERFPKEYHQRIESLLRILVPYIIQRYKDLPIETQQLNKSLSQFIKRCLSYMDRGFIFKLIRFYMERFSPGDPRILQEFKFNFLQELCQHEHYVPLNLPFLLIAKNRSSELISHFTLSEEFCRQHFLAGLLLQEIKSSLNEIGCVRRYALNILKDFLAKHELDDRYQNRGQLSRIALLYIPLLSIIMENLQRLCTDSEVKSPVFANGYDSVSMSNRMSCSSSFVLSAKDYSAINSVGSTPKTKSRLTLHFDHPSPIRASMHLKDSNYLAAIAGQAVMNNIERSTQSLCSQISDNSQDTHTLNNESPPAEVQMRNGSVGHTRSVSVTQAIQMPRCDKFSLNETKDLLTCFLFVVKHLSQDHMIAWWENCTENEIIAFLTILDSCLINFRYVGRKNIILNDGKDFQRSRAAKASTLPARIASPASESCLSGLETGTLNLTNRENLLEETARHHQALYESNLATEVGMIILDCMGLYCIQFREKLIESHSLPKLAKVYLRYLQLGQSEFLSKHVFASLRAFINNFSPALFKGSANLCRQIVYELLKACDSRLVTIRHESCAVLYLLMRSNFEFSGRRSCTRVHLQVIISVSQMIGNVIGLNNARFQESLSLINSYATSDKVMKGTAFPVEVKDLTRRVRTVLMATAQMQAHHMDPERLLELQHSLANSYATTPELRHTWLITMARNHEHNGNLSEAACCYLHIAALMAEYLKLKGDDCINWGAEAFQCISKNIPRDEKGLKLDSGSQDSQYNSQILLDQLKDCAIYLDRAERFECLGPLYRLIVPIYEKRRDYLSLAHSYEHLMQAYNKIIEVNRTGKRLLGRFYRVVFYGQMYFDDDHGIEYVYKEPKLTSLSEISERLQRQYKDKFGADVVKMIMDSSPVEAIELDPKVAYIQVTHVLPHYCKDELEIRQNEFEQNHDVDTFMYETPFTKSGQARGNVQDQWKRKTIIRTEYSFPYCLKRIAVKDREIIELSPIEVAIDEMQTKVSELEETILPPADVKKLQLRLQGSIAVQVNAGPLAYAQAFLESKVVANYKKDCVEDLKDIFRDFVGVCNTALQLNARMISNDQKEYHNALADNYRKLCTDLSELLDEPLIPLEDNANSHRNSVALFNAISGAANNSNFGFSTF